MTKKYLIYRNVYFKEEFLVCKNKLDNYNTKYITINKDLKFFDEDIIIADSNYLNLNQYINLYTNLIFLYENAELFFKDLNYIGFCASTFEITQNKINFKNLDKNGISYGVINIPENLINRFTKCGVNIEILSKIEPKLSNIMSLKKHFGSCVMFDKDKFSLFCEECVLPFSKKLKSFIDDHSETDKKYKTRHNIGHYLILYITYYLFNKFENCGDLVFQYHQKLKKTIVTH